MTNDEVLATRLASVMFTGAGRSPAESVALLKVPWPHEDVWKRAEEILDLMCRPYELTLTLSVGERRHEHTVRYGDTKLSLDQVSEFITEVRESTMNLIAEAL